MSAPAAGTRLTRATIVGFAMMAALGSVAMHLFVPAMPTMAIDLRARPDQVQLAVTLFIVGLGIGQLVAGAAADRFGRRPVLLAGLALFVIGSVTCALASGITILIPGRMLQSAGGAAIIVAVRAIIFDLATPDELSARLASLTAVVLLSPTIAPVIGGALVTVAGWRSIFFVLSGLGLFAAAIAATLIVESRAPSGRASSAVRDIALLVRNPRFLRLSAALACSSSAMYLFLSASAFMLIDRWQLRPPQAGLCYGTVALAAILGTFVVRRAERGRGAMPLGFALICLGGAGMLGGALSGGDSPAWLVAPMVAIAFGNGMSNPSALAAIMRTGSEVGGTAASLAGAGQMLASGLVTSIVVRLRLEALSTLALCLLACGLLGLLLAAAPSLFPKGSSRP